MRLAVYALTDARRLPPATGVSGERLRLYREGSLAAVAGDVRRPPVPSPDNVRRYDGTMRRLAASTSALLPARFGTCVRDADELRFILRSRQPSLQRALARVRNRVQMTVRVLAVPPRRAANKGSRGSRNNGRPGAQLGSGAQYLRHRADAAARERDIPGFEPVRASLQRWIRDERIEPRGSMVSVYHLIPRAAAERYQRALMRAATASDLRVVVTGPWPPYAFADI